MRRLIAPLALLAALCGAGPAAASITVAKTAADTITVTSTAATPNDAITYKLTAGKLGVDRTSGESLQAGLGCTGNGNGVTCPVDFITRLVVFLGPGDDQITGTPTLPAGMRAELHGGPGRDVLRGVDASNDVLMGDEGDDVLDGGFGDDTLDGGPGDDVLTANLGADVYRGGSGFDTLSYASYSAGVRVTVGAVGADDGTLGEADDVGGDLERVDGGTGDDMLVGSGAGEILSGGAGGDTLDGGGGMDVLLAGAGDDVVAARDGAADVVSCGDGEDRATIDQLDGPDSCESVDAAGLALAGAPGAGASAGAATDADGDGSVVGADCDDRDRAVHPGVREIAGNGKDDDCDGVATALLSPAIVLTTAQRAGAKATVFTKLSVGGAPRGAALTLTCKAPKKAGRAACPFATSGARASATKVVSFLKALKKAALPAGTVLELRVEAGAASVVHVERLTIRAGQAPKRATSCVNPATQATLAC